MKKLRGVSSPPFRSAVGGAGTLGTSGPRLAQSARVQRNGARPNSNLERPSPSRTFAFNFGVLNIF